MENKNIKSKNIKKYVAIGFLSASLFTVSHAGLDHTSKICPITHFLNIFGTYENQPLGFVLHQQKEMEKDYARKGIKDVSITYDSGIRKVSSVVDQKEAIAMINENGEVIYSAPEGYNLTQDENGNYICRKTKDFDIYLEPCIKSTWNMTFYDHEPIKRERILKLGR